MPRRALGDRDFLYKQRVWFMKQHPGVCTGCSTGCSILVEENQDTVYRLKPRENPLVNQWWMCDEGRYGYHHVHSGARQLEVRRREPSGHQNIEWAAALTEIDGQLRKAARLGALLSPHLTVEEAYLLAKYVRSIDTQALLALGPVPVVGEDERFHNGFTIRAEKCPNRRGVEEVIAHFMGRVPTHEDLLAEVAAGGLRGVWVSGGYKSPWIDADTAARFDGLEILVVQDMFSSPLWELATYQLPGAAFAEREGSYVNHADRLQTAQWAIRPPAGVRVEAGIYWRLLGGAGLYKARRVLDEVAATIRYFSVASRPVPPVGVDLKANLLAEQSV